MTTIATLKNEYTELLIPIKLQKDKQKVLLEERGKDTSQFEFPVYDEQIRDILKIVDPVYIIEPIETLPPYVNFDPNNHPQWQWWDIRAVLMADNTSGYLGRTIQLITNDSATLTLTGADAYRTSDGAFYTSESILHTWNDTLDKQSYQDDGITESYKTRYIIKYSINDLETIANFEKHTLYGIIDGFLIGGTTFSARKLLRGFDVLNNHYGWATTSGNNMFANMPNLLTIASLDYSQLYSFSSFLSGSTLVVNTPLIDMINSSNSSSCFSGCLGLRDYNIVNTNGVLNMQSMFRNTRIQVAKPLNTSSCTNFTSMHESNTRLQIPYNYDMSSGLSTNNMYGNTPMLSIEPIHNMRMVTNCSYMYSYSGIPSFTGDLQSATNASYMFNYSKVVEVNITNAPTVTNMSYICAYADRLRKFTAKKLIKLTDLSYGFSYATALKETTLTETINLLNLEYTFEHNYSMLISPIFPTPKVTTFNHSFSYNKNMVELSMYDFGNVTTMDNMCEYCDYLKIVALLDTRKVQSAYGSFQVCLYLETLPLFVWTALLNFSYFIYGCARFKYVPNWDLSHATNVTYTMYDCVLVKFLPELNIGNATDTDGFCGNMALLETAKKLTVTNAYSQHNIYQGCVGLVDVMIYNLSSDETMNASAVLSRTSIMYAIRNKNQAITTNIRLTVGTANKNKLTASELLEATTNKIILA